MVQKGRQKESCKRTGRCQSGDDRVGELRKHEAKATSTYTFRQSVIMPPKDERQMLMEISRCPTSVSYQLMINMQYQPCVLNGLAWAGVRFRRRVAYVGDWQGENEGALRQRLTQICLAPSIPRCMARAYAWVSRCGVQGWDMHL